MSEEAPAGVLYRARVMHRRRVAPLYQFAYRVYYLLLDIDRIDDATRGRRLFSHNRFNLFSFHDRDHGHGRPGGLRRWAEDILRTQGLAPDGGRIRLLCMPRLLGHVFNPISLWYCDRSDGRPLAVIAEVNNTFGEKHSYVLASANGASPYESALEKDKCFHVSPFFDLRGRYRFTLGEPGQRLHVLIHETREGEPILDAGIHGERTALTDRALVRQALRVPFMTLKVVAAIHWQALKIWLRGARYHPRPAAPEREAS